MDKLTAQIIEEMPEQPIAFFKAKLAVSVVSLLCAAFLVWKARDLRVFEFLAAHVKDPIPGVALLIVAAALVVSAICGLGSKYSRGASAVGGVFFLIAAGMAYTSTEVFGPLLYVAMGALIGAIVFLISAAGGVAINLDD